jgi:hypothetical protein
MAIWLIPQWGCFDVVDGEKRTSKDTYTLNYKGINITVKSDSKQKIDGKTISNLFDENPDTAWSPDDSRCEAELTFVFQKPVYITEMRVLNGFSPETNAFNANKRVKNALISTHKDEEVYDPIFGDSFFYTFSDQATVQSIPFAKSDYSTILRTKTLIFEIKDCYEASGQAKVGIRDVDFIFADKPTFTPSMSLREIKQKYINNENSWYIESKDPAKPDPIIDKVRANLIYAALRGNKAAENYLYNYSPPGAMSGEIQSYFIEWYNFTKKENAISQ